MSQPLITLRKGLRNQIFHEDPAKGMRGITLMQSVGHRGVALYVSALAPSGRRQPLTTYSIKFQDFHMQWQRAIDKIARYHGIEQDSDLYREMADAWPTFVERYNLKLTTVYYASVQDEDQPTEEQETTE